MAYRSLALVAALAAAAPACQTQRQALICAGVGGGIALGGFAGTYSARDDDEGPPVVFPVALLAGGALAVVSLFQYVALRADDSE